MSSSRNSLLPRVVRAERILAKLLGRPTQELRSGDPLDMLIGTILSQNTNDRNSHRAFTNLRATFHSWDEVCDAPLRDIENSIRSGGMAPSKSKRIQALLKLLRKKHGELSLERLRKNSTQEIMKELSGYDGVGTKTASCVCLFGLGREVFPVDTHVHRICNRLGFVKTNTPDKTFEAMQSLVPKGKAYALHTNLIRFGRRVCKAQNPQCGACPLYAECTWKDKKQFVANTTMAGANQDFMLLDAV